jgi:pimeloyl-ACP methyl ester carboxylesterase
VEVTSRGFRIHYRAWGDGPPLILVPGILLNTSSWLEAGVPQYFAGERQVIAIDQLGHGSSDRPHGSEHYRESDLPADILAVLDAEQIDRAPIWGYSRGGRLAYLFAQSHPARVSAVVAGGVATRTAAESAERYAGLAAVLGRSPDEFFDLIGVRDTEGRAEVLAANDLGAIQAALGGHAEQPVDIDLEGLRKPALVYCGSLEPWADRARSDAEQLGARFLLLEGLDHGQAFLAREVIGPAVRELLSSVA